ncbi:hypothetical protein Cgig2_014958 [Carnegiea gigantea]|uniref:Glycosyltransferase n=1 Tax=Carnegiea gigantea TaxID=171969 RepID=A0A9Q1JUT7_9CARY|nr:hypothetical protein Cgig2_014958 [Carnegiea gigantea]
MGGETEHILMIPFLAQGHLRPFMELALRLHAKTHFTITLLTTPFNAALLRQKLAAAAASPDVRAVELPFNATDHGLPAGVENTDKVPLPFVISVFHSTKSLEPHLRNFISTHFSSRKPPVCIIFDVFLGWVDPVARTFGSPGIAFITGGAYGYAAYISIWNHLPHRNFADDEDFPLPGFPENHRFRRSQFHRYLKVADGSDNWSLYFQPQLRLSMNCTGWLCNSVEEIEPLGFEILRNSVKLPIWAIGPLLPDPSQVGKSSSSCDECIQWLNSQKADCVLYISFGSQNTISPTQMMELAMGLELSGKPFLWVIRPPFGFDINGEIRPEWLPEGFEDRIKENKQGMLVRKWAPQMEILAHESTGAFLTHCGWNSLLEGLREGVPLITWPLAAEQAYNSKMLVEEMAVAVELTRGLEGKVSKEEVKRVVELVLGSGEIKKKAVEAGKKLKEAVRVDEGLGFKGCSIKAMDDFVDAFSIH